MRDRISADLVIENTAQVVTCDPARGAEVGVIDSGAVAAAGERVAWVGPAAHLDADVKLGANGWRIDARGGMVLPGFVDRVNHVDLVVKRGRIVREA